MATAHTYELQTWNWTTSTWDTTDTYPPGERAEGNAYYAVEVMWASGRGPIRLLRDGQPVIADDPETYYDRED